MNIVTLLLATAFTFLLSVNGISAQESFIVSGLLVYSEFSEVTETTEIWLRNFNTGQNIRLTNDVYTNIKPTISLAANRIAFLSNRDGDRDIYTMNLDGSNILQITDNNAQDQSPNWSPDGNQLAFVSQQLGSPSYSDIYTINADGSNPINLTQGMGINYDPSWSSDGRQIVFTSYRNENLNIYFMDKDGSNIVQLTYNGGEYYDPAWSPDKTKIAFRGANQDYYVVNIDSTGLTRITNEADKGGFAWVDHDTILYYSILDGLTLINIDGSERTILGWFLPPGSDDLSFNTLVIDSPMITQLPSADAGDDQTVSLVGGLPTQVVLNGSASSDPDGTVFFTGFGRRVGY